MGGGGLGPELDWNEAGAALLEQGWVRLERAVTDALLDAVGSAAPGPWLPVRPDEGSALVHQAGRNCHSSVAAAPPPVPQLAAEIRAAIAGAVDGQAPPLPAFDHAEWGTADGSGRLFITAHRDPDTAGGVVAILTLGGAAAFRVWASDVPFATARSRPDLATAWVTSPGDLVLLRSGGWPCPGDRCPIHAVDSPPDGVRRTLTLRHNIRGYGADYFA